MPAGGRCDDGAGHAGAWRVVLPAFDAPGGCRLGSAVNGACSAFYAKRPGAKSQRFGGAGGVLALWISTFLNSSAIGQFFGP